MTLDAARLAAVISPLRRGLLAATREREELPELTETQVEIIRALPRGTISSPGALAESLGLSRSAVSNLLAVMETAGLIARRPGTDDRRQVDVVATPAAIDYFSRYDRASAEIVAGAVGDLSPADLDALAAALPALERLRDVLAGAR